MSIVETVEIILLLMLSLLTMRLLMWTRHAVGRVERELRREQ